ncbi:hypothetical protein PNA2_1426 [Pyrococcus sp. NA2]|uniref:ArnT family glycosyltransferase n=1 Tax=Pyrococcus sp. (strain NA2) TaxID=342949 RepID=UPI000209AF23|nr:glycosyltransferase family 39 protein [Pyrococcus sp. NA2]AEC52341.1 hypothetical protein PNA2_1426 [Pyrococcus sp. NA2]
MNINRHKMLFLIVFAIYIALRLPLLFPTNEYWDYDEGTYLLIARYINQGYMPYRDILAVHPPFFYFVLAFWLRLFGDSYIVGRLLSLSLGAVSLIFAYKVGEKIKDKNLGIFFSLLLALDPQTIILNSTVLHGSLIEFFVLLTLYLYIRGNYLLMAFLLGIGTSVKHTFLPYAVGILAFLLIKDKVKIKNINLWKILSLTYLTYIIIVYAIVLLYPVDITRMLFVVPGIGDIKFKFSLYALLLFFLLFSYYAYHYGEISLSGMNVVQGLKLFLIFTLGKLLLEGPFLVIAGKDYLRQVYFMNMGRGIPLMSIPDMVARAIRDISRGRYEFLYPYFMIIMLTLLVTLDRRPLPNKDLKGVTSVIVLSYLLFPLPEVPRFLYPLFILLFLILSSQVDINGRKLVALIIIVLVIDCVFLGSLVTGRTRIAFAVHSDLLRKEIVEIVPRGSRAYSFNPMTTYLLELDEPPYYIDNFGAFYLGNVNSTTFLNYLESNNVTYIIIGTWLIRIMKENSRLESLYSKILRAVTSRYELIYAHSFSDGELIAVYRKMENIRNELITINVKESRVSFEFNGSTIFYITPHNESAREVIVRLLGDTYIIAFGNSKFIVDLAENRVLVTTNSSLQLEFLEPPILLERDSNEMYLQGYLIKILSGEFDINGTKVLLKPYNETISLSLYRV